MGYKDKKYAKPQSLHKQMYSVLVSKQAFGQSKRAAKRDGTYREKIFSFKTFQSYKEHCQYFVDYIKEKHPECKNLKQARRYIPEWLQTRVDKGLSAWTVSLEMAALGKLYNMSPGDPDYYTPPKRRRQDIKRSRNKSSRFSEKKNTEIVRFCRAVGPRRSELTKLKGRDLLTRKQVQEEFDRISDIAKQRHLSQAERLELQIHRDALAFCDTEFFVNIRGGKGGKDRISPIVGPDIEEVVSRFMERSPDEKVFLAVSRNIDVHSYRSDYANRIYRKTARPIDKIPYDKYHPGIGKYYQSEVYHCRGDEKGRTLDRRAMLRASKALGHNRIEIVANNYLRGI